MRGKNNFMLYLLAKFRVFMLYLLAKSWRERLYGKPLFFDESSPKTYRGRSALLIGKFRYILESCG